MKSIYTYLLSITLTILCLNGLQAQSRFGQYGAFEMLGHSNLLNPALVPEKKLTLDLPFPPTIYGSVGNTLSVADIFTRQDDGLYHFNSDRLLRKLNRNNYVRVNADIQLMFFGLKKDDQYFSFNINQKTNARITYPKSLISWPLEGPGTHGEMNLNQFSAKASNYTEFGFGYTRKINDQLTIGGRLKRLQGVAFAQTDIKGSIVVGIDSIYIQHDPLSAYTMDFENIETIMSKPVKAFLNKNGGFGLDIGGTYTLSPLLTFSASLLDLGMIRWKTNTKSYSVSDMSYSFKGVDIAGLVSDGNTNSLENDMDAILDNYQLSEQTGVKKTQSLSTKFYGGVHAYPHTDHQFNFLLFSELYNGRMEKAFSLGYNYNIKQIVSLGLNYSYKNGSFNHVGIVTALRLAYMQFYLLTDNINLSLRSNEVDFQLGFSMVFGKSEAKKQKILERKSRKNKSDEPTEAP